MIDTVQIRRRGAVDFESYYEYACTLQDLVPLPAVRANLCQGVLDINGDRIKLADWTPILNSLAINKHLHHVAVRSCYQPGLSEGERYRSTYRKRIPAFRSKDMTFRLCKSVRDCLSVSHALKSLELQGLPLRERDLVVLTKGLAKTVSLENLSLAYCPIADEGLEVICQSVKNSSTIKTVNFTGCNLTWRGAEHMANIIKHQATRRHSEAWAESLRYRRPDLDCMAGLRRISMCCNTLIGDRGSAAFADALGEDLWLKALDLQKCGISNAGAKALLDMLHSNSTLVVLDLRKNPLVDNALVKLIIERVLVNANGTSPEYKWIQPPSSKESLRQKPQKRTIMLGNGVKGKATIRIGSRRPPSNGRTTCVTAYVPQPLPPGAIGYTPWRTAARACRQRGFPRGLHQENVLIDHPIQVNFAVLLIEYTVDLEECLLRLKEEKRARAKLDARLVELEVENTRLRNMNLSLSEALHSQSVTSSVLEDEAVFTLVQLFKIIYNINSLIYIFCSLGQLASMAGIDQSDFGPLGVPQLSSTVGTCKKGGSEETEHKRDEMPSGIQTELQKTQFFQESRAEEAYFKHPSESGRSSRQSLRNGAKDREEPGKQQSSADHPSALNSSASGDGIHKQRRRISSMSTSGRSQSLKSGSQTSGEGPVGVLGGHRSDSGSADHHKDQLSKSGSELHCLGNV
nr:PREDICTED: centrosomal protein of 78 kDa [Lepisosteus oculatus]